jgi:hypothetical protein
VVEGGPHGVQRVPNDQRQRDGRGLSFQPDDVLTGLRIEFGDKSVSAAVTPVTGSP